MRRIGDDVRVETSARPAPGRRCRRPTSPRSAGSSRSTWRAIAGSKIVTTSGTPASRCRTSSAIRNGNASSREATQTTSKRPDSTRRAHALVVGLVQPVDGRAAGLERLARPPWRGRRHPSRGRASRPATYTPCGEISAGHRVHLTVAVHRPLAPDSRAEGFRGERGRGRCDAWATRAGERRSGDGRRWRRRRQRLLPERRRRRASRRLQGSTRTAVAAPAVPTFVNGLAQNVFSTAPTDWDQRRAVGRVRLRLRPRRQEGPHARRTITLPQETHTDGLKVPVDLRGQPVLRGRRRLAELARRPRARRQSPAARIRAPFFNGTQHEPEHLQRPRGDLAAARLRRRALRVARARATPTAARPPAAATRRSAPIAVIDWLNGRTKGYTTRDGHRRGHRRQPGTTARRR